MGRTQVLGIHSYPQDEPFRLIYIVHQAQNLISFNQFLLPPIILAFLPPLFIIPHHYPFLITLFIHFSWPTHPPSVKMALNLKFILFMLPLQKRMTTLFYLSKKGLYLDLAFIFLINPLLDQYICGFLFFCFYLQFFYFYFLFFHFIIFLILTLSCVSFIQPNIISKITPSIFIIIYLQS